MDTLSIPAFQHLNNRILLHPLDFPFPVAWLPYPLVAQSPNCPIPLSPLVVPRRFLRLYAPLPAPRIVSINLFPDQFNPLLPLMLAGGGSG